MLLFLIILLTPFSLISPQFTHTTDIGLHELMSDRELERYNRKPKYQDRIDLFRKVFDDRTFQIEAHVDRSEMDKVTELLHHLDGLSHYAARESSQAQNKKSLRSRQVKKLEIRLRKLVETLDEMATTVPYEDQEQFAATSQSLERLRKSLLAQIFGHRTETWISDGQKKSSHGVGLSFGFRSSHTIILSANTTTATPQSADRFTESEFIRIQSNRELDKRVNVFLEIAHSRLDEIKRRVDRIEWEDKDPNPLEFYTYDDMVHAYEKAIEGIMINVDEKAINKLASEKDIRQSLEKLSHKLKEFIPQLVSIKELAVQLQDENLYTKVLQAEETSKIAQKGTVYGLGAPVN